MLYSVISRLCQVNIRLKMCKKEIFFPTESCLNLTISVLMVLWNCAIEVMCFQAAFCYQAKKLTSTTLFHNNSM